jgi:hypothetical protein
MKARAAETMSVVEAARRKSRAAGRWSFSSALSLALR